MNQDNKVSLGCGTLILIALIVLIFGNHGGEDLVPQVRQLKDSVQRLESKIGNLEMKIDAQSRDIEALRRERDSHGEAR
jgi:hypothetical protein